MVGRVRRKAGLAAAAARQDAAPADTCALCARPLGRKVEWHHVVPKSEGGREMVPVHPICHRTIHATVSNADLARLYPTMDALREREESPVSWRGWRTSHRTSTRPPGGGASRGRRSRRAAR